MIAEVVWRSSINVNSIGKLDDVLDAITKDVSPEHPQAVQITRTNGDCLTIVIGSKAGSVLSFIAKSGDPPYFASLGDPMAEGIITYNVNIDHHTEALAQHIVSEAAARQAVRDFVLESPSLPKSVTWVEV